MEQLVLIAVLVLITLVVGAILGSVAFARAGDLGQRVQRLERRLAAMEARPAQSPGEQPAGPSPPEPEPVSRPETTPQPEPGVAHPAAARAPAATADDAAPTSTPHIGAGPHAADADIFVPPRTTWLDLLLKNWMIWLGGICVGLGGVFMVKYGIERGLLGPEARIALGLATGVALHGAAEWLRRRAGGSDPVFAALAGGASITLFAALLAALHLYQLIDPRIVFGLLALVALLTMSLALVHGPVLAALGILGAYVVPVLVSNDSGNILGALLYALIVSVAALLLLRYVYRPWLWWGVLAGGLGWWLVSLGAFMADNVRGIYLAFFAWSLLAVPRLDWLLLNRGGPRRGGPEAGAELLGDLFGRPLRMDQAGLLLVLLAWGATMLYFGWPPNAMWHWTPLILVSGIAAINHAHLRWLPWLTLLVHWVAWLGLVLGQDPATHGIVLAKLPPHLQERVLWDAGLFAALYAGLGVLHLRLRGFTHPRLALASLSPFGWLLLAYLLTAGIERSLPWSLATAGAGLLYALVAAWRLERHARDAAAIWFILGAHVAYALAVSIWFREAGLTLALAAQLVTLSWLLRRYRLPWLGLMLKAVLAIVVVRLTFNPWLASYPADVHWSLWTYGGAAACAAVATWLSRTDRDVRRWLEAATLHLGVLFLGAEVRYWLYDGRIFSARYDLKEAAINTPLWAGLALVYRYRANLAEHLAGLYRIASNILLALAAASYAAAVVLLNPWWGGQHVGATPVFNLLLPAYGLPVIMALLVARFHAPAWRRPALISAAGGLLLFVTLEIRHLWQGRLGLWHSTGDGELYTYSVAWLALAVGAILGGAQRGSRPLYKAGMALLAVVIAKIFLIDLEGLQGLWRVASFMGLGLSLLGLAWLHGRIRLPQREDAGAR